MKFKDLVESKQSCPHCGGPMFSEMLMMEKKDACYYKVKASAKVWPSAYASGRLVQCRKKGAGNYGNKSESMLEGNLKEFAPGAGGGDAGNYFQTLARAWYNGAFDTGSLQKGIKSKEDIERLLQRGIVCPDGVTRKFSIDYNSDFDGVVISSDDYYEHADHDEIDSRTGKPFGPYDYMEFGDDDLDESAKWRDPKYKGQLYTQEKPDYNDSREYDNARWYPKPKGYKGRKEPIAGGEFPRTDPLVKGFGRYGVGEPVSKGPRKGLPSRDQITSLKQSIKDISGKHTRANLPEMDKSQTPPGRDGSNDPNAGKKEYTAKTITPKKVAKHAEKILNKELNKKPGVAEGLSTDNLLAKSGFKEIRKMKHGAVYSNGHEAVSIQIDPSDPDVINWALGEVTGKRIEWIESGNDDKQEALHIIKTFTKTEGMAEAVRGAMVGDQGVRPPVNQDERNQIANKFKQTRAANRADTRVSGYGDRIATQSGIKSGNNTGSVAIKTEPAYHGQEMSTSYRNPRMQDPEYTDSKSGNLMFKPGQGKGMAENYNPEYDDEAGMADNNLETLDRAVEGIDRLIDSGDNLPEWCQEKIAVAKSMLVAVWDYMYSEEASDEVDPEVDEMFEAMDQLAEEMAVKNGVSADLVWEQFEALPDNVLYETAAWRRKEGKSKKGGLNAKGVASYRRENPGSKLQMAVTTKPSKLKPGSKAAKRRKSFCARMSGVKGPMKKPNGKPTRKALALRKWNC